MKLYELAGKNPEMRFSPYCWRSCFALAHKDINYDSIAWRFTEKEALAFSGQGKVPVLVDGDTVVHDSWAIAEYLDSAYPNRPPLFPNGSDHARFINAWADTTLNPAIGRLVLSDIHAVLSEKDQAYFRQSRESMMGRTLEEVTADRDERVHELRKTLQPVRSVLKSQPWLGGDMPDYADYIVAGSLQWPRVVSKFALLAPDDAVTEWFTRVLALTDGVGENVVTV